MKAKRVRINQGTHDHLEVRYRLLAQELGYGDVLDELFAATPTLTIVKLLMSSPAARDLTNSLLDLACAFLSRSMRRTMYIEFPECCGGKALYGTR